MSYRAPTVSDGTKRVLAELARMGVAEGDAIISTNVRTRLDGLPRSDGAQPDDVGAAVYWSVRDRTKVMAIDHYDRLGDNLAAIAATLAAMRAIERHGGAMILDRAFTGFDALPAPGQLAKREWWDVLECRRDASRDVIEAQYRRLRSERHPDKGGSSEAFDEVQRAHREATDG